MAKRTHPTAAFSPLRSTRQEQWEQRRLERERANQQSLRQRRIRRVATYVAGGLVVALLVYLVYLGVQQSSPSSNSSLITGTGTGNVVADGSTVDGMSCLSAEGAVTHIHIYLAIYINGQPFQVPPDTGIVNNGACLYPLHVHADAGDENIIHQESPNGATYTLGAFFDIWGQRLSRTSVMGYKSSGSHPLTFITFDGAGHKTVVTGNPLSIKFSEHETIYILYNSPNVTPKPFTKWIAGE